MSAAELAVVGGAAGVGAVVGALASSAHVSWARQRWPVRPAPSVVVIDCQPIRLLRAGGAPAAGGRALRAARPYDWARDGEAVGA